MLERKQVINGCNGKCCEAFTLAGTIDDLKRCQEEVEKQKQRGYKPQSLIAESGYVLGYVTEENEFDKLLDMLIPLGQQEMNPQKEITFAEEMGYDKEDVEHTAELVLKNSKGHVQINKEGKLVSNIYTCRHFDKENKVCNNYENRPLLCRAFGEGCKYKGCNYVNTMNQIERDIERDKRFDTIPEPIKTVEWSEADIKVWEDVPIIRGKSPFDQEWEGNNIKHYD